MATGRNRYGRKDHSGCERAIGGHRGRRLRRALLTAALASLALGIGPAQAITGGAGVVASDGTVPVEEGGLVFSSPMRSAGATWYGPGPLRQQHRLRPDPLAGNGRRRPQDAALRDGDQVRLPRSFPRHPGDRSRALLARQRLRPDQRRPPSPRLRRGRTGALRGRSAVRSPGPLSQSASRICRSGG